MVFSEKTEDFIHKLLNFPSYLDCEAEKIRRENCKEVFFLVDYALVFIKSLFYSLN